MSWDLITRIIIIIHRHFNINISVNQSYLVDHSLGPRVGLRLRALPFVCFLFRSVRLFSSTSSRSIESRFITDRTRSRCNHCRRLSLSCAHVLYPTTNDESFYLNCLTHSGNHLSTTSNASPLPALFIRSLDVAHFL